MVKHNNVIPNIHLKKKHSASSRGPLKAKLNLDQASKKKSRRMARAARAARIAPRPLQMLRPIVHCQTQKYSAKTRLGRGFSLQEVKAAGLTPAYARTVGIAVDHRRTNRSAEGLNVNVERLKEYTSKLVVFPRRRLSAPKAGDSSADDCKAATQHGFSRRRGGDHRAGKRRGRALDGYASRRARSVHYDQVHGYFVVLHRV